MLIAINIGLKRNVANSVAGQEMAVASHSIIPKGLFAFDCLRYAEGVNVKNGNPNDQTFKRNHLLLLECKRQTKVQTSHPRRDYDLIS